MHLSNYVEKWDSVLFEIYNFIADCKWALLLKQSFKTIMLRNKQLKNKYEGQRCFIVLNGPSLKEYDLQKLKNEVVITTNFFFRSDLAEVVRPDFVCWQDATFLINGQFRSISEEIFLRFPHVRMIINSKGYDGTLLDERVFYTYNKHLPNKNSIHSDLSKNCSAFSTVAFYAINCAIYMGFKEIYLLGLDFGPGGFKHFANLGVECDDPQLMERKEDVCAEYWSYSKAHFESYALNNYANRKGYKIVNLNKNSFIRAFEFGDYNELFNKN